MNEFATIRIPPHPTETAPDGSAVRVLLGLAGGTMAHFELSAKADTARPLPLRKLAERAAKDQAWTEAAKWM